LRLVQKLKTAHNTVTDISGRTIFTLGNIADIGSIEMFITPNDTLNQSFFVFGRHIKYIFLKAIVGTQYDDHVNAIKEGITESGEDPNKLSDIKIYDCNKLAEWANAHPQIAIWVNSLLGALNLEGYQDFDTWTNKVIDWLGLFDDKGQWSTSFVNFIEQHVDDPQQLDIISTRLTTGMSVGSYANKLEREKDRLQILYDRCFNPMVKSWVRSYLVGLETRIQSERLRDENREASYRA